MIQKREEKTMKSIPSISIFVHPVTRNSTYSTVQCSRVRTNVYATLHFILNNTRTHVRTPSPVSTPSSTGRRNGWLDVRPHALCCTVNVRVNGTASVRCCVCCVVCAVCCISSSIYSYSRSLIASRSVLTVSFASPRNK
jgi:hypothetical protein